ncbi:MAG: ABC transporter permease, partial [Coriobacteriia bacterium]|nr:ABC transporter permease [Coriobacteriia bacterium]
MDTIVEGLVSAVTLLLGGSSEVWEIILRSIAVSATAVVVSTLIGVPVGYLLGARSWRLQRPLLALVNTGMALPPVVAGLIVYVTLSRGGPLGDLGLLFTRPAMVIAQVLIATPLVAGVTAAAVGGVPADLRLQVRSLGATWSQEAWLVLRESRRGVFAGIVAGFGGVISEVGAVMMVGGNISGSTRVMTTAIVLETRRGEFGTALALGLILVGIAA